MTLIEAAKAALAVLEGEWTTVGGDFCRWCEGRLNGKHDCELERSTRNLRDAIEAAESAQPVGALYQHPMTGKTVPLLRDDHGKHSAARDGAALTC